MKNISKQFGGVHALEGVNLEIRRGEILGLLGDNGAGKTTLVKIISGVHPPSGGEIECNGAVESIATPQRAQRLSRIDFTLTTSPEPLNSGVIAAGILAGSTPK